MRKLICLLLALTIACGLCAYAEPADTAPDPALTEAQLTEMLPVIDALARTLDTGDEAVYNPNDAAFVWTQLRALAAGTKSSAATTTVGPAVTLSAEDLTVYAAASFAGMTELPPLPAADPDAAADVTAILYDADANAYAFAPESPRQIYTVIERWCDLGDSLLIGVGKYERTYDFRLGGFTGVLVENALTRAALEIEAAAETETDPEAAEASAEAAAPEQAAAEETAAEAAEETAGTEAEAVGEAAAQPLRFPLAVAAFAPEGEDDFFGLEPVSCYLRLEEPKDTLIEEVLLPFSALSWGSSGTEVAALQRRLEALGYDCGGENGVYGTGTLRAVRYFQEALNVPQDGIATIEVQNRLFSTDAPAYDPYVNLRRDSEGVRVEELQNRLRELGYTGMPADGVFEDRTRAAVVLFQTEAGLDADGIAGRQTLTALYAPEAPACTEFIDLSRGDTGIRVTEMQEQLLALQYMRGWASGTYDAATAEAVSAYAAVNGIAEDDGQSVSAATVARMFGIFETPEPTVEPEAEALYNPNPEATAIPTPTPRPRRSSNATATPTEEATEAPEVSEAPAVELETPAPTESGSEGETSGESSSPAKSGGPESDQPSESSPDNAAPQDQTESNESNASEGE